MSKTEFIWFFGASAAGKETIMQEICRDKESNLRNLIGINETVRLSYTSLYVAGGEKDYERKLVLTDTLEKFGMSNSSILIKGQTVDFEPSSPLALQNKLPNAEHKIVFLWVEPDVLLDRNKVKHPRNNSIQNREQEVAIQVDEVQRLSNSGFDILCLDNTYEKSSMKSWNEVLNWRKVYDQNR